jgi:DNA-binding response OmpR family regulator
MDDDPNVAREAVDFLKFIGYRLDPVADGEEAIKANKTAQEAGDPYAALILDSTIHGEWVVKRPLSGCGRSIRR